MKSALFFSTSYIALVPLFNSSFSALLNHPDLLNSIPRYKKSFIISNSKSFKYKENRKRYQISPCLSPFPHVKNLENSLLYITLDFTLCYILTITLCILPLIWFMSNLYHKLSLSKQYRRLFQNPWKRLKVS